MRNVFLLALLSVGCVAELEDIEDVEDDTSSRVALNGLTAPSTDLSLNVDPSLIRAVAKGSLATAGTRVPALFTTAKGREQFAYLYGCAERPGKTLTISANGTSYVYEGAMGLAREWLTDLLPSTKYKLVSACMLARTNYFGIHVSISMRNKQIATPSTERDGYTVVEGAFWGDVFTPGAPMRACASPTKLSGVAISTLPQRECAVSVDGAITKCGFGYAGDCSNACVTDLTKKLGYSDCEGYVDAIAVFVAKP